MPYNIKDVMLTQVKKYVPISSYFKFLTSHLTLYLTSNVALLFAPTSMF